MDIRMSNIASPMPQIRAKFTNKLGIPLSGCKVYTYEPNSNIPKKTWIDIDKTVENTNPILLDSAGEADIFIDGLYRIVVKDRFEFVVYDVEKTGTHTEWDASFVVDGDKNQKQINEKTIRQVESISDLTTITNPKKGQVVYVKSHYAGLNAGGGWFTFTTTAQTLVQGLIVAADGGYWVRDKKDAYSIHDSGAHESLDMTTNTTAINALLQAVRCAYVPNGTFNIDILTGIQIPSNTTFFGYTNSVLLGQDADANMADVSGAGLYLNGSKNFIIKNLTIKNGYRGKGIFAPNVENGLFEDVTIDGFSYGSWVSENDSLKGSKNIVMVRPRILNTKYWGTYFRGFNIAIETDKTKNIKVIKPYYYNCNMAAFVVAEGKVSNILLDNPVFERCNVCMHFEHASDYTVINPTSIDTGKKPDHLQANHEYPYVNWSLYQVFTQDSKVLGGNLDSTVWLGAGSDAKSWNHEYLGLTCKDFVFEGVGTIQDLSKDFFKGYTFSACTTTSAFIYQQTDTPLSYLRDFKIVDCSCLLGESGNSGSGSFIGMNPGRAIDWKVINNRFKNSAVRIGCEKTLVFKDNTFDGTDETQSRLDGVSGVFGSGSFLNFSGNTFQSAGGGVFGDAAILIRNWSVARVDNVVACNGTQRGYRFTDNFRIELGAGLIYNETVEKYAESGTTSVVFLSRA